MFDRKIKTPKGAIFCAYFKREPEDRQEMAATAAKGKRKIYADVAHGLLEHMNNVDGQCAIKNLGY